jgi:hypothetical protein
MKHDAARAILYLAFLFGSTIGLASTGDSTSTAASPPAVATAGPKRPANVPSEYVITPFGYFHPSCVQSLSTGERLLRDGRLQHADGTSSRTTAVCHYPRYTHSGSLVRKPISPAEVIGWIENANVTTGSATTSYGALKAIWTVPPHPAEDIGQILFFYPGFQDINDPKTSILQPVLRWQRGQWDIESWNCCLNNIANQSTPVNVKPGDEIYGSITSTCPPGTLSCSVWNVLTLDLSSGQSTTLADTPSDGRVFNWAFGGVMEPYYVVSCADYPPNQYLNFDNVAIFDQNLNPVSSPKWSVVANTTATPQCHYGVVTQPDRITLQY